jgi:hypothetical protein
MRNSYGISVGEPERRKPFEDMKIILKLVI